MDILNMIRDGIVNLDSRAVQQLCEDAVDAGIPADKVVNDGMAQGMLIVGKKFEAMEYFLTDLIMAGETMEEGMKILEPYLKVQPIKSSGKVVIGTVEGDLHYIGKRIVITLLKSAGFDVTDLGEDVPPAKFLEAVKEQDPDIVGMSALITPSLRNIGSTISALKKAGLRDKVKVIVGGASTTEQFAEKIGADAWAKDAVDGVNICKAWMEGRR